MENYLPTAASVTSYFMFEFASGKLSRFTSYMELMKEAGSWKRKKQSLFLFHFYTSASQAWSSNCNDAAYILAVIRGRKRWDVMV